MLAVDILHHHGHVADAGRSVLMFVDASEGVGARPNVDQVFSAVMHVPGAPAVDYAVYPS